MQQGEVPMIVYCGRCDGPGFEREFSGWSFLDVDERLRAEYVHTLRQGIKRVMGYQCFYDWDPKKPRTPLARCLFNNVASGIGDSGDLGLFIAIGTRLDLMGIDCFFKYHRRVVTIDLTVRPFKEHPRSDFVLSRLDFLDDEYHERLANRMARKLAS